MIYFFFFFNDTATTEIYTLSLHDALPIWFIDGCEDLQALLRGFKYQVLPQDGELRSSSLRVSLAIDRKSTRLNSSHLVISYAVFCLKKKKKNNNILRNTAYIYLSNTVARL